MASLFTKLECIGNGSFGQVWLVNLTGSSRNYVMKEVKVHSMSEKQIKQAVTEVKVLSLLGHFNIIRYKQAFAENQGLRIIMEYAEGDDLRRRIERQADENKYFEEGQVLNWFIQLCFAIKYIHKENILHRDLKTQNILLTKDNILKVADFGISTILPDENQNAETIIGTPFYLSPEICQSEPYMKKSDIWALGCILYEVATLKYAFDSTSFNNLLLKIIHGEYGTLPAHYPYQPISWLVEMMLQHSPDDRPAAGDILRLPALRSYISQYEEMALRLIETSRGKKHSTPVARKETRKHSLTESRISDLSTPRCEKRRSQSVDLGKKTKDLRKAVILRQALTCDSTTCKNLSSLPSSPSMSPIAVPVFPEILRLDSSTGSDSVFDTDTASDLPKQGLMEGYCKALVKAKREDKNCVSQYIEEQIQQLLGADKSNQLMLTIHYHMNQLSSTEKDEETDLRELRETLSKAEIPDGLAMMIMFQWFLLSN